MASVPKSRRKKHDFKTTKVMKELRKDITETVINDFGYDTDKYQRMINRFAELRKNQPNAEKSIEKMQAKHDSFYDGFIEDETRVVMKMWRDIAAEFEMGNSIFPSGDALIAEYCERRLHLDRCIGHLRILKSEIQFIGETLPVDKNKYDNLATRIEELVSLVKGVRQASNRFLKAKTVVKAQAETTD